MLFPRISNPAVVLSASLAAQSQTRDKMMSLIKKFQGVVQSTVAGSFLSASLFLLPASSDAMHIKQFNQMSGDDQGRYFSTLNGEVVKYLWRQGRKEDADAVMALFKRDQSSDVSEGMREFIDVMNTLNQLDSEGRIKQTPHVEQALGIVLKDHGVVIPINDLMLFAKDFKPKDSVIGQSGGDHRGR